MTTQRTLRTTGFALVLAGFFAGFLGGAGDPPKTWTRTEIVRDVESILVREFELKKDELKPSARLKEDLKLDDLDLVEFWMQLEDHFLVIVPDDKVETLKTLGDVYALLEELLGSR